MERSKIGFKRIINKFELLCLIAQALNDLGHGDIAESLEELVPRMIPSSVITSLVQQLESKEWDQSINTLRQLQLADLSVVKDASILILKQKLLGFVKERKRKEAVMLLRNEKVSLSLDLNQVGELAALLACPSFCADTDIIAELQGLLSPLGLVNQGRLVGLVEQGICAHLDTGLLDRNIEKLYAHHGCANTDEHIIGKKILIDKTEFTRIISEAMYFYNCEEIAEDLQKKAKIASPTFLPSVLSYEVREKKWDKSLQTLQQIEMGNDDIPKSISFLILKGKLMDLMYEEDQTAVRDLLENQTVSLGLDSSKIKELASIRRCGRKEMSTQHHNLYRDVDKLIPDTLNEGMLVYLLQLALEAQKRACPLHNTQVNAVTLYADHLCGGSSHQVLDDHKDEVQLLQFSHNGKYLASSSKNKSAFIWKVNDTGQVSLKHRLGKEDNTLKPVSSLALKPGDILLEDIFEEDDKIKEPVKRLSWSRDDGELLTFSSSTYTSWSPTLGVWLYDKTEFHDCTSFELFPDGNGLVCIKDDRIMFKRATEGFTRQGSWSRKMTSKSLDIAITEDARWIITMWTNHEILLHDWETRNERFIVEDRYIKTFSLSKDSNHLLVTLDYEIHIWNIESDPRLVATFKSPNWSSLVTSCFGGDKDRFVASGSENSKIYIWDRNSGNLVLSLHEHTAAVKCVSWNPTIPSMLASASEDGTIRIWGAGDMKSKKQQTKARLF